MLPYSPSKNSVGSGLSYEEPKNKPRNKVAFIFGSVLGLIVLAGAVFAVYYIFFRPPLPNISMQITSPEQVLLGEPFRFTISYTNASEQPLSDAVIAVTVPEDMAIIGIDPATRLGQQSVGNLPAQGIGTKTFELVATGGENSVKRVTVSFRYRLEDGGTVHERTLMSDISVGASAITLNFDVPQRVFAQRNFNVGVSYQNNSANPFQNVKLIFDYPPTFQPEEFSSGTISAAGEWDLGILAPGSRGDVTVTGKVSGDQQTFFPVGVHLQAEFNGHRYDIGARTASIAIQAEPLTLSIVANGRADYVASLGEKLSYVLDYRNRSQFSLQNVIIKAYLKGDIFDIASVESSGALDSTENALTWDNSSTPALRNLAPGQSGKVEFRVELKKDLPIQSAEDKNFSVEVVADIRSLNVPSGISAEETVSSANLVTRLAGGASIATLAYFREPSSAVVNNGPYPPMVNQSTQYTIHWQIRNYSTDLTNVHVSTKLEPGVRMVRIIPGKIGGAPVYNSQTKEIVWNIPSIEATQGYLGEPIESILQIEVTPAVNQVGRVIPLIGPTTFTAKDAYTGQEIKLGSLAKDTNVSDDPQAPGGDGRVKP